MRLERFWLTLLLTASVTAWGVGCGGGAEEKPTGVADEGSGTKDAGSGTKDDSTPGDTTDPADDGTPTEPAETEFGSAKESAEAWFASFKAGDAGALWMHLPPSYRTEINEIIHLAADRVDETAWDKTFAVLGKVTGTLKKQKQYVLGNAMVAQGMAGQGVTPEVADATYDGIVGILDKVFTSDISKVSALKSMDLGVYLDETMPDIWTRAAAISKNFPEDPFAAGMSELPVKITEIESTDTTATLEYTKIVPAPSPNDPEGTEEVTEQEEFVKVEGKWLPKEVAEWPAAFAEAKKAIADMPDQAVTQGTQQMLGMLGMVEGALDEVAAADSQEAFDAAVNAQVQKAMPLVLPLLGLPQGPPPQDGPDLPPTEGDPSEE